MKTFTLLFYFKGGIVETAKNTVGEVLVVKEHSLQDVSLLFTDKIDKIVAVCNQDYRTTYVWFFDSESKDA